MSNTFLAHKIKKDKLKIFLYYKKRRAIIFDRVFVSYIQIIQSYKIAKYASYYSKNCSTVDFYREKKK